MNFSHWKASAKGFIYHKQLAGFLKDVKQYDAVSQRKSE